MKLWIWRHFRIKLPDDWEMLRFSQDMTIGRCMFADRYQFRLELNWRQVTGPPDFDRMLSDYMTKLKEEFKMSRAAHIRSSKWRGIEGYINNLFSSRLGCYFPGEFGEPTQSACVIEIVFTWPEGQGKDPRLEKTILDSVAPSSKKDESFTRWKSFGMDMQVNKNLSLTTCEIRPAYARMTFTSARQSRFTNKPKQQEQYQRLGMVKEWLKTSPRDWLPYQLPKETKILSQNLTETSGHRIETISAYQYRSLVNRWFGKPISHQVSAWICPRDGRLYSVNCTYPAKDETLKLFGQKLSCCSETKD